MDSTKNKNGTNKTTQMTEVKDEKVTETYKIRLKDEVYDPCRLPDGRRIGWIKKTRGGNQEIVHRRKIENVDGGPYFSSLPDKPNTRLILPTGPGRFVSPKELFDEARALLGEAIKTPTPQQLDFLAANVLATYQYDLERVIGYVGFEGIPKTGKTQALHALAHLCFNSLIVSGTISEAALFREIHLTRGTLFLDEVQRDSFGPTTDRHKLLTEGNQAHGVVTRCVSVQIGKKTKYATEDYDVFCPKILSGRSLPNDDAIVTRTLVINTIMFDNPSDKGEVKQKEEKLADPAWNKRAEVFRNNALLQRQLRALGETQAPGEKYKSFLDGDEWDSRDRQVFNWILKEIPTEPIAKRVVEAISAHKVSIQDVREEQFEAQVLLATRYCLLEKSKQNHHGDKNVYAKDVIQRLDALGQGKYHPKGITRVWRDNGIKIAHSNQGKCVRATMAELERAIKRLGIPLPEESFESSSSQATSTPPVASPPVSANHDDEIPF